jgi:hypothetical protein
VNFFVNPMRFVGIYVIISRMEASSNIRMTAIIARDCEKGPVVAGWALKAKTQAIAYVEREIQPESRGLASSGIGHAIEDAAGEGNTMRRPFGFWLVGSRKFFRFIRKYIFLCETAPYKSKRKVVRCLGCLLMGVDSAPKSPEIVNPYRERSQSVTGPTDPENDDLKKSGSGCYTTVRNSHVKIIHPVAVKALDLGCQVTVIACSSNLL